MEDLGRRIGKRTRAVLCTHYFGFPQALKALRALCDEHSVYLIEDCAHALFSCSGDGYLGTWGDASVFSLRKTLPVPNGGALVLNRPGLVLPHELYGPPWPTTWSKTADLVKKWVLQHFSSPLQRPMRAFATGFAFVGIGIRVLHRFCLLNPLAVCDPDDENFDFDDAVLDWNMAKLGHRILGNIEPTAIVARRRTNYSTLLAGLC